MVATIEIEGIDEIRQDMSSIIDVINRLSREVADLKAAVESKREAPKLVLGIFRPGEMIKICDKRLWTGEGAPFGSYSAVRRSREAGCMWLTAGANSRGYRIMAEDLRDWLNNSKMRRTLKG